MPEINPDILRWARETAGLSESEAVAKLKINDARGKTAIERLRSLELGDTDPSRAVLVKMATKYRRPLLTFYLSAPPRRGDRGQDFRVLPMGHSSEDEALLDALIRDVLARQSLVKSALIAEDEVHPLKFIRSVKIADGVGSVVQSIRATLGMPLDEFRAARDQDEAFQILRTYAEDAGIFVLLIGNLGSHHTNIDLDTFRGFAIADATSPFIVINDQDHRGAWSFTLIHELTHLLLGQTGVSGRLPERAVEKFCNNVASEFLLPTDELEEFVIKSEIDVGEMAVRVGEFAGPRNVSRSMVAYRLFRLNMISESTWQKLNVYFRDNWFREKENQRAGRRGKPGGPDYYVVRRHRLGNRFVQLADRLLRSGALTTTKTGQILGVKPKNVGKLISEYRNLAS